MIFQINQSMLQVYVDTTQTPLNDAEQLDLVLSKIPTKALYNLHMSVTREIQYKARMDPTKL